jgi:hypothetical protein
MDPKPARDLSIDCSTFDRGMRSLEVDDRSGHPDFRRDDGTTVDAISDNSIIDSTAHNTAIFDPIGWRVSVSLVSEVSNCVVAAL